MSRLLLLRVLCAPLPEDAPKNHVLCKLWLRLMEARYKTAENLWGRERARVYDYIPF